MKKKFLYQLLVIFLTTVFVLSLCMEVKFPYTLIQLGYILMYGLVINKLFKKAKE